MKRVRSIVSQNPQKMLPLRHSTRAGWMRTRHRPRDPNMFRSLKNAYLWCASFARRFCRVGVSSSQLGDAAGPARAASFRRRVSELQLVFLPRVRLFHLHFTSITDFLAPRHPSKPSQRTPCLPPPSSLSRSPPPRPSAFLSHLTRRPAFGQQGSTSSARLILTTRTCAYCLDGQDYGPPLPQNCSTTPAACPTNGPSGTLSTANHKLTLPGISDGDLFEQTTPKAATSSRRRGTTLARSSSHTLQCEFHTVASTHQFSDSHSFLLRNQAVGDGHVRTTMVVYTLRQYYYGVPAYSDSITIVSSTWILCDMCTI